MEIKEIAKLDFMKFILPLLLAGIIFTGCKHENSTQQSIPRQQKPYPQFTDQEEIPDPSLPLVILSGQEYFDNKSLSVEVFGEPNRLIFSVSVELSDSSETPKAYNPDFHEYEEADHLEITILGRTKKGRLFATKKLQESMYNKKAHFDVEIDESELRLLKAGKDTLTFGINFKYTTFFGRYSKTKMPVSAEIKVPFEIQPIYESCAYFKSLKLNLDCAQSKLGTEENDFGDGTPEACINISSNNKTILYEKSKNSYTLNRTRKAVFYHSEPNPSVHIGVYDADYGLNFDDLLGDTVLLLNQLTYTSYQHLPIGCADELKLYFSTKGQINR